MIRRRRLLAAASAAAFAAVGIAKNGGAAPAGGAEWQDIAPLEELARAEAQRQLPALRPHQRLQVGPIPPHLQLARCDNGVRPSRAAGVQSPDRVLIELRCTGTAPWHVYVPVRIVGTSAAVVTAHAIIAGSVLGPQDLRLEQRDLQDLPPGYLDDVAIAVGLTAGRSISGGSVLTNQQLLAAKAVQRGQTVTLLAGAGGINVRMTGRALADAMVNQRIRVENLSSGKIVEGIARSTQVVEIVLQ
jgi:flagella basal body P-ring formation protein FlgA